jgi:hypothetical protein
MHRHNIKTKTNYRQAREEENILVLKKKIIQWKRVLLEKPPVTQLLKNFPKFYESRGSLPCSQELSIGPYPKPD